MPWYSTCGSARRTPHWATPDRSPTLIQVTGSVLVIDWAQPHVAWFVVCECRPWSSSVQICCAVGVFADLRFLVSPLLSLFAVVVLAPLDTRSASEQIQLQPLIDVESIVVGEDGRRAVARVVRGNDDGSCARGLGEHPLTGRRGCNRVQVERTGVRGST